MELFPLLMALWIHSFPGLAACAICVALVFSRSDRTDRAAARMVLIAVGVEFASVALGTGTLAWLMNAD